jgi:hypothetical protein
MGGLIAVCITGGHSTKTKANPMRSGHDLTLPYITNTNRSGVPHNSTTSRHPRINSSSNHCTLLRGNSRGREGRE